MQTRFTVPVYINHVIGFIALAIAVATLALIGYRIFAEGQTVQQKGNIELLLVFIGLVFIALSQYVQIRKKKRPVNG